jgi:transposase InsO family protein
VTSRSNERWCSDALEFTCWNGEIVRVAFAQNSHDREVISWVATTAEISGEMIRDVMVLKRPPNLSQPALEFSGVKAHAGGGADEPFNSDIGA